MTKKDKVSGKLQIFIPVCRIYCARMCLYLSLIIFKTTQCPHCRSAKTFSDRSQLEFPKINLFLVSVSRRFSPFEVLKYQNRSARREIDRSLSQKTEHISLRSDNGKWKFISHNQWIEAYAWRSKQRRTLPHKFIYQKIDAHFVIDTEFRRPNWPSLAVESVDRMSRIEIKMKMANALFWLFISTTNW